MPIIRECRGFTPKIAKDVFIAENAVIIGDVEIGEGSSVWYNVVLRGDVMPIRIGKNTNIQDGTVVHGTYEECGTTIGDRVTIGHMVMLHGCTISDAALIGMGATVMDRAEIGQHCLVGAGSLVTEGKKFMPQSLIVGRPAAVKRSLREEEIQQLEESAEHYLMYKSWY